jgi:hypothetical protein
MFLITESFYQYRYLKLNIILHLRSLVLVITMQHDTLGVLEITQLLFQVSRYMVSIW